MKSPFPGMDPYLERYWGDVHAMLVSLSAAALNRTLPAGLAARMEERVVIDSIDYLKPRVIYPDVRVREDPNFYGAGSGGTALATATPPTIAQPILIEYDVEEHIETFIEVLDLTVGSLVTVIEVLSRSNKLAGKGRVEYRRKRKDLEKAGVNLVEIDLLRRGSWRELLSPAVAPARVRTAYRAIVRRGPRVKPFRPVELYPIRLRDRLPVIPIPLRPGEADATLDFQALVDQAYINGRYNYTRYDRPCSPPLSKSDAAWAAELIAAARPGAVDSDKGEEA